MGSPVVVEGSVPEGASAGASAGLGDVSRSLTEHFDGDERGVAARAIQELKEALCAVCEWRSRAEAAELEVAALREKCGRYRCRARDAEAAEGRFAERGVTSFLETLADELAIGAIRLARAELGTSEEDRLSSPSDAGASPVAFARASTPTLATPFGAGVGSGARRGSDAWDSVWDSDGATPFKASYDSDVATPLKEPGPPEEPDTEVRDTSAFVASRGASSPKFDEGALVATAARPWEAMRVLQKDASSASYVVEFVDGGWKGETDTFDEADLVSYGSGAPRRRPKPPQTYSPIKSKAHCDKIRKKHPKALPSKKTFYDGENDENVDPQSGLTAAARRPRRKGGLFGMRRK